MLVRYRSESLYKRTANGRPYIHKLYCPKTLNGSQFTIYHMGKGQKLAVSTIDPVCTLRQIAGKCHTVAAALFLLFREVHGRILPEHGIYG